MIVETKECIDCFETKLLSEFTWCKDHYYNMCKPCRNARKTKNKKKNFRLNIIVEALKSCGGCAICGFTNISALEFHHREPLDKTFCVSQAANGNIYPTEDELRLEITKCDVLCANCHLMLTVFQSSSQGYRTEYFIENFFDDYVRLIKYDRASAQNMTIYDYEVMQRELLFHEDREKYDLLYGSWWEITDN